MAKISRHKPNDFGTADYRQGALERLADASQLLRIQAFAGSIYLAGRSVEGMLRAVIWRHNLEIHAGRRSLDIGHDLKKLLSEIGHLGLLRTGDQDDQFRERVQFGRPAMVQQYAFCLYQKGRGPLETIWCCNEAALYQAGGQRLL